MITCDVFVPFLDLVRIRWSVLVMEIYSLCKWISFHVRAHSSPILRPVHIAKRMPQFFAVISLVKAAASFCWSDLEKVLGCCERYDLGQWIL